MAQNRPSEACWRKEPSRWPKIGHLGAANIHAGSASQTGSKTTHELGQFRDLVVARGT